ncbi:MAG: hypothetical protein IJN44_06765 [Clostridia bacterium]|nr:hypothetical protein [Clostridia bacterium]
MKKHLWIFLCIAALAVVLPLWALAGGGCDTGYHDYDMTDVKYPTCTEDGYYILKCKDCGHTKKESNGEATGCEYEKGDGKAPTCTVEGYQNYVCIHCGNVDTQRLGSLGHDWKDDGVTYPDCENPGLEKMYCARCGEKWESVISALGHTWKEREIVQDATCEMTGTSKDVCETCGKELLHEIDPKGHSWKHTHVIREATCTKEGKADAVCRECGKEDVRVIKKAAHTFGEWTITKQATETKKGTRKATCQVCGKKVTESFEYVPGDIAVYTASSKVNLRSGAGKNNKQMGQVEKKGTYLGQLYEAQVDKNGDVWYKVKYKEKFRWVMAKYAEVRVDEEAMTQERLPQTQGTELSLYLFKSVAPVAEMLEADQLSPENVDLPTWQNDVLILSGEEYVEHMRLHGEGYSLYGIRVGDKIKNVQTALKKKNLPLHSSSANALIWQIPAMPDALEVDDEGFCAYLVVDVSENNTVEAVHLYANTVEHLMMGN